MKYMTLRELVEIIDMANQRSNILKRLKREGAKLKYDYIDSDGGPQRTTLVPLAAARKMIVHYKKARENRDLYQPKRRPKPMDRDHAEKQFGDWWNIWGPRLKGANHREVREACRRAWYASRYMVSGVDVHQLEDPVNDPPK